MKRSERILVIGEGIVGLSIAFELLRRGAQPTVLGRARAGAATPASGGMLAPSGEIERFDQPMQEAAQASLALWPGFLAHVSAQAGQKVPLRQTGTLLVSLQADHRAEHARLFAQPLAAAFGLRRIDSEEARTLEPALSPRILEGLYAEGEACVDPRAVQAALNRALELGGVERLALDPAMACDLMAERPSLSVAAAGDATREAFDAVVLAEGAFATEWLPDLHELRPVKGQYAILKGPPLLSRIVQTPDVYLVPREDGVIYVGASMEDVGFTPGNTPREIARLFHEAWRVLPETQELDILEIGFGFRPAVRGHAPLLRPIGPRAVLAVGHSRHGILLAPWTAARVADHLLQGRPLDGLA